MLTIHKFKLDLGTFTRTTVEAEPNAHFYDAGYQGGTLCLWALVDDSVKRIEHTFELFGTGWPVKLTKQHTFFQHIREIGPQGGHLEWFIYRLTPLVSLKEFNARAPRHGLGVETPPEPNGIACPDCGNELVDSYPNTILPVSPPKKEVSCSGCDFSSYRRVG